jgi:hypothetical protein
VGKVTQNSSKTCSNNPWDVFQEHESRSHLSDNPADVGPDPSLVVSTELLPGNGEGLTWESRSDEIHDSTPRLAVECRDIVPDRSLIQSRLFHPCHESGRRVGIPLNVTHGSGRDSGVAEGKLKAPVPGAKVEGS